MQFDCLLGSDMLSLKASLASVEAKLALALAVVVAPALKNSHSNYNYNILVTPVLRSPAGLKIEHSMSPV